MSSFRLLAALCGLLLNLNAHADPVRVLASIKPVQQIAAAVLDGIDTPAALLPAGASPHSFALRPSDRRALASAERIYWVGPSLELFLQSTLHELPSARELAEIPGCACVTLTKTHRHMTTTPMSTPTSMTQARSTTAMTTAPAVLIRISGCHRKTRSLSRAG